MVLHVQSNMGYLQILININITDKINLIIFIFYSYV